MDGMWGSRMTSCVAVPTKNIGSFVFLLYVLGQLGNIFYRIILNKLSRIMILGVRMIKIEQWQSIYDKLIVCNLFR